MKSCILSKQCMPEGGDQRLWRVTEDKVAGNQARRGVDLLLAVEGIEQSSPDLLDCNGQIIEAVVAFAW